MLSFSFIFSLLIICSLQIKSAFLEVAGLPELNEEILDQLDFDFYNSFYNSKICTTTRLYRMSNCLGNFFDEISTSKFWHWNSHKPWKFCKQGILPTKDESPFLYKACEFICGDRDHQFMARNILYTGGLIGNVDVTDISLGSVSLSDDNNRIEYTIKVNDKKPDTRNYELNIGKNTLQAIIKEDHDSSIVLNNLRTIAANDLLENTITKENLLNQQNLI